MSAGGTSPPSRPIRPDGRLRWWLAAATAGLMVASILAWAFVGIVGGLSELDHTPEQGGCYQPRVAFGIALIALAAVGALVAAWTLRAAVLVVRGRRRDLRFLRGVLVMLAAAGAVLVMVLLRPELQFGAC